MSVTSAAVPMALLSFADAALALDDSVARAARQAGDALAAYRASAPEFGALPPPVEGWLAEDAAEARSLDTWVGLVGRAFQLADSGVSFLGGIFTLLLGGFPTAEDRTGRSVDDIAAELRMSDDLYDSTQGPIDGLQEGVELADDGLQGFEGWLADQLPDPLDDLVEFGGDVRGTVVDYGRTAVDFGQRVTSPDFIGDVVGDLDEMGALDQVEDVALDVLIPGRASSACSGAEGECG